MAIFSEEALSDMHVLITRASGDIGSQTARVATSRGTVISLAVGWQCKEISWR